MPRRSDTLAVVVACDDGRLRERVAKALGAAEGIEVVAAIDTVRMGPSATRLRPDAVVLISPRPRFVDLGRIGTLARERAKWAPVVVLLADDPEAIDERARAAGAKLAGPVPDGDARDLACALRRLCGHL
jgi:DNA-binding NarL/FixJ family response regulator